MLSKRWWLELGCVVGIISLSGALLFPKYYDAVVVKHNRLPPIPPPKGRPLYSLKDAGEGDDGWLDAQGKVIAKTFRRLAWHEEGATLVEVGQGKSERWEVTWRGKTYDLGNRWQQDLRNPVANAKGQLALTVFGRPLLWFEGKWTPLLPGDQRGTVTGLNAQGQAVGVVARQAYLWSGTTGKPLLNRPSTAAAINDRGDIIGALGESHATGYFWQKGTVKEFTAPLYSGEIAYLNPVALNERADVVGNAGLVPPTDAKHQSTAPWSSPFVWQQGRTTLLEGRIEQQGKWVLDAALAINDRGEILVRGHEQGKTYPSHLLLLTPRVGIAP
ncbi:hypothetical protein [Armatimonas rosea]|uniref:HAF family extracellular repeat protein n=1 Tax=Armatimonas rosea TaxID=685828 RepID=A0A7W9SVG4_ARMRO|nr:hypothetical protein [Armatimonas rosea]MBB6053587.1 hypothetical protein [Armatimonas rosea]